MYKFRPALMMGAMITINCYAIPEIVITSARTEQRLDDVITTTNVITRSEIEQDSASGLLDLLKNQAGFDVAATGGKGQSAGVFVRGVANKQTLVLIDGVRASSAVDGLFAWQNIDPEIIERIEITRGSRSSIYGSDAIGGVVQIFTRKHNGYQLKIGGGSYGTKRASLSLGKRGRKSGFNLALSQDKTAGFSATNQNNTFSFNPDDDSSENLSVTFNGWVKLTNNLKLGFSALDSRTDAEFDQGETIDDSKFITDNQTLALNLTHRIKNNWQHKLALAQAKHEYADKNASNSESYNSNTTRRNASWQHQFSFKKFNLTTGVDYIEEQAKVSAISSFGNDIYTKKIDNRGMYLNLQADKNIFKYGLGVRRDKHQIFGSHDTWGLDAGLQLTNNWLFYTNRSKSFRAPNVFELFSQYGNPELKPEEANSLEVGLKYQGNRTQAKVNLFDTNLFEQIDYDSTTSRYINSGVAKIWGLEVELAKQYKNWEATGALTLQNAKDKAGNRLIRRPDEKLSLALSRNFAKGFVRLSSLSVGKRDDGFGGSINLPSYTVADFTGKYNFNSKLAAMFKVENLTDHKYEAVSGYNTPERSYYLTLEYTGNF